MKKLLLLPLLLSLTLPVAAQNWVTIPDANFANKLNELFPECMDGNLMNTECTGITQASLLELSFLDISDLTGIEYFTNLQYLYCDWNNLSSLPPLPENLTYLNCNGNILSTLPPLPENLTYLTCDGNNLNMLPSWLPNLTFLSCNGNNISALPIYLPETLVELQCQTNFLDALPELPWSLEVLHCASNNLSLIPELPDNMIALTCFQNDLTFLPELPANLITLHCGSNNLTSLPELPATLLELHCGANEITCFPLFPENMLTLNIISNPFTCLPNYVPAMSANLLTYPLCDLGGLDYNPYGCSSVEGIGGTVFDDSNANCEEDGLESGLINATIKLMNEEGELVATTNTIGGDNHIFYNLAADTGNYTVQLVTENMPFQISCDDPGDAQDVELTTDEPSALNVDFGVECLQGFDIGVQSLITAGWVFPGQVHTLKIAAGDMTNWYGLQCAEGVDGTVTVYVDGPVSYVGPANNALTPSVTGELQFTYSIADFGAVNFQQDFALLLETDTTAQAGESVCVDIVVDPISGDSNPANNTYNHCYSVQNSYDPNIKQVWPHNVEPGYDDYFNYTIYFQNTGTAPAFNIRVADTLDTNLDLNTFEVTAYSHACLTYVSGNVATFRFNNIMLPDSTTDLEGSIGYVQYRIKPIADLPVGTVIENTAHIFFDFNDAIVTNTTLNEYVIDTSIDHLQKQLATVFPNPGTGQFNVLLSEVNAGMTTHLEVYNLSGQRVQQRQVNENRVVLDLTGFPSGMYILHLSNENGSDAVKLVKH